MRAVAPMRKSWKRIVIQARMPIDPRMIRRKACWIKSLLTMPLIELRLISPSIGPKRAWRAVARAPSWPAVGGW